MDAGYRLIVVRYGIGYGKHETEIEVPDDASQEEIDEYARDAVLDRVWWAAGDDA